MTVSAIGGASVALAALQAQATAPASGNVVPMDLATANAILGDYVTHGKKLNHYTQAQTDAATKFINDQLTAFTQQAGGNGLAGTVAFLQSLPADLQNTAFYGLSINNTTLTGAQDLAVSQALLGARDRQTALLKSGAIAIDGTTGQQVGTNADGTTVVGILSLLGSKNASDLIEGARQWNIYAASLGRQDTVDLSQTAQTYVAASTATSASASTASTNAGTAPQNSPAGIVLQLAAGLTSGSNDVVHADIQTLVGIVNDQSLSWTLADQVTAQTALGYLQANEQYLSLSQSDTQAISDALTQAPPDAASASAYDRRVGAIGAKFKYGDTGQQAYGALNFNNTVQPELGTFLSLSSADQALWFVSTLQKQGFASISDYISNVGANDIIQSIVSDAVKNKTTADPLVVAAQKLLQTIPTNSKAFTDQVIKLLADPPKKSAVKLAPGALDFLQAAAAAPTTADQALQILQGALTPSAAEQAALDTLKSVLQSIKDAQTQKAGKTSASPTASAQSAGSTSTPSTTDGLQPKTPTNVPTAAAASGKTATGLLVSASA